MCTPLKVLPPPLKVLPPSHPLDSLQPPPQRSKCQNKNASDGDTQNRLVENIFVSCSDAILSISNKVAL